MAWKESERPNLGPIWAQRPRMGITERWLDRWRLLYPRSLETNRQIAADLGVKGSRVQILPARQGKRPSRMPNSLIEVIMFQDRLYV
jgi:hypothetical protein